MVWREEPRSCSFTLHGDQFVSAVYNPNAARRGKEREREREKRGGETDPSLAGLNGTLQPGLQTKRQSFGIPPLRPSKKPTWSLEWSWWSRSAVRPCVHSCCCCIQRSHETRRLSEGPPPSLPPFPPPSHGKWKLWQSGGEKRRRKSARQSSVRKSARKCVRILHRV